MLAMLSITEKSLGTKLLFEQLQLTIEEDQKVAIIGRNGVGKSTLFRMLTGEDTDFSGSIDVRRNVRIVSTAQEHHAVADQTPLAYILAHVPDYVRCKALIDDADGMGEDMDKIAAYSDAVQLFADRDYYTVEDRIVRSLEEVGLTMEQALAPMRPLSGGEKRLMELVKVEYADADLALLDEPTNHLDAWGKDAFLRWLDATKHAVLLITHDRDVLRHVERMVEIKDQRAYEYAGNYDQYLKQNAMSATEQVARYEDALKRLEILHGQIQDAKVKKISGFSSRFRSQQERLQREYDNLKENAQRPSLWIDQTSVGMLEGKAAERYDRYKDRNIQVHTRELTARGKRQVRVKALSLGYDHPLFAHVQFDVNVGDRVHLKGRNGAGKSTLVRAILARMAEHTLESTIFAGDILPTPEVRVGVYEQEFAPAELEHELGDVITRAYLKHKLVLDREGLWRTLVQYLFDPREDEHLKLKYLSGGQKARVQLIKMLANAPQMLVLDEPTNHLDLPSIEELEKSLKAFQGSILYVSHDHAFVDAIGGTDIMIPPGA